MFFMVTCGFIFYLYVCVCVRERESAHTLFRSFCLFEVVKGEEVALYFLLKTFTHSSFTFRSGILLELAFV